ncbi:MAG: DUF3080 family protein [Pseudomonadales bacterium]
MRKGVGKLSVRVLLPGLLLLVACQPNMLESGWRDYLSRIATALHTDLPVVEAPAAVAMPRVRELQLANNTTQRSSIGILEFLALDDCKLKQVIAARNSPLGKLAPGSQQLVYELRFLQHAPACIDVLQREARNELAAALAIEFEQKQAKLPVYLWRATLGGPEFRELWQVPAALGDYPASVGDELVSALQQVQAMAEQWLAGNYAVDMVRFETLLGTIRRGDAGRLHRALAAQAGVLRIADTIITHTAEQRADLCNQQRVTAASKVFNTVVKKFWLGKMQLHAAALNRRYYGLHETIMALESLLAAGENATYRNWREQRDADMQAWLGAPRKHVEAIQLFYDQCGIST